MDTTRLKQARRLFTNELASRETTRYNMRSWVKAVRLLGDKWVASSQMTHAPLQKLKSVDCILDGE